jgi:hypothetical protein
MIMLRVRPMYRLGRHGQNQQTIRSPTESCHCDLWRCFGRSYRVDIDDETPALPERRPEMTTRLSASPIPIDHSRDDKVTGFQRQPGLNVGEMDGGGVAGSIDVV